MTERAKGFFQLVLMYVLLALSYLERFEAQTSFVRRLTHQSSQATALWKTASLCSEKVRIWITVGTDVVNTVSIFGFGFPMFCNRPQILRNYVKTDFRGGKNKGVKDSNRYITVQNERNGVRKSRSACVLDINKFLSFFSQRLYVTCTRRLVGTSEILYSPLS